MNNRKLIFGAIIGGLLIILLIFLLVAKSNKTNTVAKVNGDFNIWIVGDSSTKFDEFLTSFKNANKSMSNVIYNVKSFSNFEDYSLALNSAFIKGQAPDLFVLNNNETSLYEDKIYALSNLKIDIHKFKQEYKPLFIDDLIVSFGEGEEKKEYLKGIPVGYETLGVFYNKGYPYRLNPINFSNISSLLSVINKKKEKDLTTIALGNGSTIVDSGDILLQFLLINGAKNLDGIKANAGLLEYMSYGSEEGDNKYNSLKNLGENNVDLFIEKEVGAIIAYPRVVKKLKEKGFNRNLLFASAFPHRTRNDGPTLANYNYFVINNDSTQKNIALSLLKYLNSDNGAEAYLNKYKYYLPSKAGLENKLGDDYISDYFGNIVRKDFYSEEPLTSFDKGNKIIFDKDIKNILDNSSKYLQLFSEFKRTLSCKTEKILELKNLTTSCE